MIALRTIATLILGVVLVACAIAAPQPTAAPDYSDIVITLERTACFGTCPIYTLTVYGDGRVEYEGEMFVAVEGQQSATISAEQVQALVTALEQADYLSLSDDYSAPATDLPSTITSVTLGGKTKTINHYGYCEADFDVAPKELCDFEQKIDEVTNSAQWVGTRP
ncbi:MAG TPA: DUF6438 domain-containing protein [Anaerolineales bacterium]|nr:DUF6438 domain-containing protein [Anaerolineales bacterium]